MLIYCQAISSPFQNVVSKRLSLFLVMHAMLLGQRNFFLLVFTVFIFSDKAVATLEFQPGAGVGIKYTDNARLLADNVVDDVITVANVGASLSENEGPLKYNATTSFNDYRYMQNTFADQHYFDLAASADWEMIKHYFNWKLSDYFRQQTVDSLNSDTPDNLQDSNVFTIGADIMLPLSGRNNFTMSPMFSQYYYEVLNADNKQYSLAVNWDYKMSRLTSIGLDLNARKINYTETNFLGQSIDGTTYTNFGVVISSQRSRSNYSANLGATSVRRDNGYETSGLSGFLRWQTDLSAYSDLQMNISTDLTDTSSAALGDTVDSMNINDDVQISTSIIRNSNVSLAYLRRDASLHTRISGAYHKVEYSNDPLDRVVQSYGVDLNYPITQLLSGGVYIEYNHTEQLDLDRIDEAAAIGGNLQYKFSRKLRGLFDLTYRKKESTYAPENYSEFSIFASIVYGFGDVRRP